MTNPTLRTNSADGARRQFMATSLVAVVGTALGGCASVSQDANTALPYPQIADTSAATPELVAFMQAFFRAKTNRDVDQTMAFFAPDLVTYIDSTLGWDLSGFDTLKAVFAKYMPNWPVTAASYPTRIMGNMQSALVAFTDTPELFGGELRILGAIDFKNGKIARWVDYWDARAWPNLYKIEKSPPLRDFGEQAVGLNASNSMKAVVNALSKALSKGDSATATALFSNDAIYEDLTLRTQVIGKDSIGRYLGRALKLIPFGTEMQIRHVVGSDQGGGFEWVGGTHTAVKFGVTALVLDRKGAITKMSTVYDGENIDTMGIKVLAMLGVEP